ncbi:hypothetical protein [Microbulbifer sp. TYP-18]|uniref:hypothetical protein n=1 Tax=Microbulbifer sp. TYP-18 TaxID=3230024 RepID=UPI0034C61B70
MNNQKNRESYWVKKCILVGLGFVFLLSACTSTEKLVSSDWYEIKSQHFRIVTNGNPKKVQKLAEDLEQFRIFSQKYIAFQSDQQSLTIYALADQLSFARVNGSKNERNVIGSFRNTSYGSFALVNIRGNRYFPDNPARKILFHEYTHFLTYSRSSYNYPYWYSEGLAESFSTVRFNGKNVFEVGRMPVDRAISLSQLKQLPLKRLLEATRGSLDEQEAEALYASGWMLTHWLLFDPERKLALERYLKAYQTGADSVTALPNALDMTFDELEAQYQLLSKSDFVYFSGQISESRNISSALIKPMMRETAIAEIAHFMAITRQKPSVLQDFFKSAKQKGVVSPPLQAALAISESQAGNFFLAKEILKEVEKKYRRESWYLEADAKISLTEALAKNGELDVNEIASLRDQYVHLVNTQEHIPAYWHELAITMQLLGYPREQYLEMLEQAYWRAPRDINIAWWFVRELYVSRDKKLFPYVAHPLLMQIYNKKSRAYLKSMIREIEQEQELNVTSELTAGGLGEMLAEYHQLSGNKALALAIDYSGAYAVGYVGESHSQAEAKNFALKACEERRANYSVRDACTIYAEGNDILDSAAAIITPVIN